MVILLKINITYSNVIAWYDMTWNMIYHMICDSYIIWYMIWQWWIQWIHMIYDMAVVDSEGAAGLHRPPLGQYIHFFYHTTFMFWQYFILSHYLDAEWHDCIVISFHIMYGMVYLFIILKYPILQQQLWQCYYILNLPSSPGLAVMCCNWFSYAYNYM